jgi:hypothetical protein
MADPTDGAPAPEGPPREGARAPYEKPAVTWEEPLGLRPGLAAACGKVTSSDLGCDSAQAS